jgi:hypothetical protein
MKSMLCALLYSDFSARGWSWDRERGNIHCKHINTEPESACTSFQLFTKEVL